jgi:hypothetical protein
LAPWPASSGWIRVPRGTSAGAWPGVRTWTNPPQNPWAAMVDGARSARDNGRPHAFPCLPPLAAHCCRGRSDRGRSFDLPACPRAGRPNDRHRRPHPGPGSPLTGRRSDRWWHRSPREACLDAFHTRLRLVPVHDGCPRLEAGRRPRGHDGSLLGDFSIPGPDPSRGRPSRCTGRGLVRGYGDPGHSPRVDGRTAVRLLPTSHPRQGVPRGRPRSRRLCSRWATD